MTLRKFFASPHNNQLWTPLMKELSTCNYPRAIEMIKAGANVNEGIRSVPPGRDISVVYTAIDRHYPKQMTAVIFAASDGNHLHDLVAYKFYDRMYQDLADNRFYDYHRQKLTFIAYEAILRMDKEMINLFIRKPIAGFSLDAHQFAEYMQNRGEMYTLAQREKITNFLREHVQGKIGGVDSHFISHAKEMLRLHMHESELGLRV